MFVTNIIGSIIGRFLILDYQTVIWYLVYQFVVAENELKSKTSSHSFLLLVLSILLLVDYNLGNYFFPSSIGVFFLRGGGGGEKHLWFVRGLQTWYRSTIYRVVSSETIFRGWGWVNTYSSRVALFHNLGDSNPNFRMVQQKPGWRLEHGYSAQFGFPLL